MKIASFTLEQIPQIIALKTPYKKNKKQLMYLRKHHVSLASQKSKARKDLIHLLKKSRDGLNGLFKLVEI